MSVFIGTLLLSLYTNLPSQDSLVYNKVAVPNDTEEVDSPNLIKPGNSFNYPRKIKKLKISDGKQHRICHFSSKTIIPMSFDDHLDPLSHATTNESMTESISDKRETSDDPASGDKKEDFLDKYYTTTTKTIILIIQLLLWVVYYKMDQNHRLLYNECI